ncbi:TolC family protein [Leptospira sp. 96542]|nr:TolC family protein [Leptospira sp. 96542]
MFSFIKRTHVLGSLFFYFAHSFSLQGETNFPNNCNSSTDLYETIQCIVSNHPNSRIEGAKLQEMMGRKKIASYYFPSNPSFSNYIANRRSSSNVSLFPESDSITNNFQLMVNQEIFTNGKREIMIQIADEEFQTQVLQIESTDRALEFDFLKKIVQYQFLDKEEKNYFESLQLVSELKNISKARVNLGLSPGIDESLSEAEEIRLYRTWNQFKRYKENLKSSILVYLNEDFPIEKLKYSEITIPNNLPKTKKDLIQFAIQKRPELKIQEKDIELSVLRRNEIRNQKIPNVSFGAFVQNDGFNERVVGGMFSFQIPVWRNYEAETSIGSSKIEQSKIFKESVETNIKQEVIIAITNYVLLSEEMKLFDDVKLGKAEADINHLQEAIKQGKIKVIDAINHQRILIQTIINHLSAKSEFEMAKIELLRVLGYKLKDGGQ